MSTARAMKSLWGHGASRAADQWRPSLAQKKKRLLISSFATAASTRLPISTVCWSCRNEQIAAAKRQQSRPYSSSKPPSGDSKPGPPLGTRQQDEPQTSHRSPSSSIPPDVLFRQLHESQTPSPPSVPPPPETAQQHQRQQETPTSPSPSPSPSSSAETSSSSTSSTTSQATPEIPDPELPSSQNSQRSALNRSLSQFMDRAQTTLFAASQRINDLTGYTGIETLKSHISTLESQLRSAQTNLTESRASYKQAVSDRSATQREVTTLLARQKTWTPLDFERFTTLYRQDYELEASVADRAAQLEAAERETERLNRDLSSGILARYHEEQIWSDKIRRMSTWGTWGLMGVNVLLFLLLQFGAEPWRRRRLVRGFEEKVREALAEQHAAPRLDLLGGGGGRNTTAAATAAAVVPSSEEGSGDDAETAASEVPKVGDEEPAVVMAAPDIPVSEADKSPSNAETAASDKASDLPSVTWRQFLLSPDRWRLAFVDLASERLISIRMRDISLIAAESVAAGATFAAALTILILRRW